MDKNAFVGSQPMQMNRTSIHLLLVVAPPTIPFVAQHDWCGVVWQGALNFVLLYDEFKMSESSQFEQILRTLLEYQPRICLHAMFYQLGLIPPCITPNHHTTYIAS